MARILRGDVVWADLNPARGREQAGLRPVVVISADVFNARSGTVIALAPPSVIPAKAGIHRAATAMRPNGSRLSPV